MKNQVLLGLFLLGIVMFNPAHATSLSDVTVDDDIYVEATSVSIDYYNNQITNLLEAIDGSSSNISSDYLSGIIQLSAYVDDYGNAIIDGGPDIYILGFIDDLLIGDLRDASFDVNGSHSFSLLFQTTGGSAASEFGGYFVATFTSSLRNIYASPSDIVFPEMGSLRINAAALNNVSEPATLSLLAIALLGGPLIRRRKRSL